MLGIHARLTNGHLSIASSYCGEQISYIISNRGQSLGSSTRTVVRNITRWLPNTNDNVALMALKAGMEGLIIQGLSMQSWMLGALFTEQLNNGPVYAMVGITWALTLTLPN
ncbi:hypothetical protein N7G274_005994 [Stereocaulon virgatum]|uniref:ABC transmembrane type-1 domain-containing protein n=1 Tax=Stereocaulon virgatum TaxID=373712 RepID=A0ABR4A6G2_9LECA